MQVFAVQQESNGQGGQLCRNDRAESIEQGGFDGLPEEEILGQELYIVLETDKIGCTENALVRKGNIQAVNKLPVSQKHDAQQQGQHEQIAGDGFISPHDRKMTALWRGDNPADAFIAHPVHILPSGRRDCGGLKPPQSLYAVDH